jgi:hypothetical protein
MPDPDRLDRAIAVHAKWKYRLADAIRTGTSDQPVVNVRSDTACEFGKWLLALPLSERLSPDCQKVRELHAAFHAVAADVLEMALGGRVKEAEAAIVLGGRFAEVSSNLTMAVLAWKEAARGPGGSSLPTE